MAIRFPDNNVELAYHVMCTLGITKRGTIKVSDGQGGTVTKEATVLEPSLYRNTTLAKQGGRGGYAFSVVENGGNNQDGILIDGALPYWNIWSTQQPGFWWAQLNLSDFTKSIIRHRLRYNGDQIYYAGLAEYNGYWHLAKAPYMEGAENPIQAGNSEILISMEIVFSFGSYDWSKVLSTHQYYQVIATKEGYPEVILGQSEIKALPAPGSPEIKIVIRNIKVSNSTSSYPNLTPTIGRASCWLCKSDGSQRVRMPNMEGELKLIFDQATTITANIYVNGDIQIMNKMTGGVIDRSTFERDVIIFSQKRIRSLTANKLYVLSKVGLEIRSKKTGQVLLTEERSVLASYLDTPKRFETNSSGEAGPYDFQWDFINSDFDNKYDRFDQEVAIKYYYTTP